MTGTNIQQDTHARTVFDVLPSVTGFACRIAAARGESEEAIAEIRRQHEAIDRLNPFHHLNGSDN